MIYIATLHHSTNKFIDLQDAYYKAYTKEEYVLYAGLSDLEEDIASYSHAIDAGMYEKWRLFNFDGVENQQWHKLNCLVDAITQTSETPQEEDLLVFTDGDAFPVAPWEDKIRAELEKENVKVVAIQRSENPEPGLAEQFKPYPHPCFFATKLKFWLDNKLGWGLHPPEIVTAGPLLKLWLQQQEFSYTPLLRTNLYNIHPLYFGIYGDMIYHHGAGNREVYDSIDIWPRVGLNPSFDLDLRYPSIPAFNKKLSDLVFEEIIADGSFINVYLMGRPQ